MDIFKNQIRKQVNTGSQSLWALFGTPKLFTETKKKYPIIVFIHGSGEVGSTESNTEKLCVYGPCYLLANGQELTVNREDGKTVEFLTLAIQQKSITYTTLSQILYVIDNDELLKDRVAEIFITGLSLGAQSIFEDHWKQDISKLSRISGFAPFSGDWYGSLDSNLNNLKLTKTPVVLYWGTQENSYVLYGSTRIPSVLNGVNKNQVVTGYQTSGHCCWNVPYSTTFKFSNQKNLYENFAQYVKVEEEVVVKEQVVVKEKLEISMSGKAITEDIIIDTENFKFTYKIV